MREILFRGKRKDNGEWIEGYLHKMDGYGTGYTEYGIQVQSTNKSRPWSAIVIPGSVGQFTGATDKNGRKIFDGDIVKYTSHETKETYLCTVSYNEACAFFQLNFENKEFASFLYCSGCACEAIGNVFDNPELLKGD